jgi:hypothetical protein
MPSVRAATILLLIIAVLGLSAPAQAFDQKTQWFTMMVKQASDSAPPLFLTNDSDGVMLERYRSGDVTQMWTTVDVDYPTIPRVTSSSGVDIGGVFGCLAHVLSGGCPFSVTVGVVAKVVNRASGGCLVFGPHYYAITKPCLVNSPNEGYQLWRVVSPANSFTSFRGSSGDGNCLASQASARTHEGLRAVADGCNKTAPGGSTLFVLQLAADLTCKTDRYFHICFTD